MQSVSACAAFPITQPCMTICNDVLVISMLPSKSSTEQNGLLLEKVEEVTKLIREHNSIENFLCNAVCNQKTRM